MALADRIEEWKKEYGPGGNADDVFLAGAQFAYLDAAWGMGMVLVYEGDFDSWVKKLGFSPVAEEMVRKVYTEAYENGRRQ
jgi:hypothetical protein